MRFTTSLALPSFFLCCPSQRQGTRHPRWLTTTGAAQTRLWAAESDTRPVSDAALGKCTRNAQKKSKTVSLTNTRGKQRESTRCNVSNGQKELWALGLCLIYSFSVFVWEKKKKHPWIFCIWVQFLPSEMLRTARSDVKAWFLLLRRSTDRWHLPGIYAERTATRWIVSLFWTSLETVLHPNPSRAEVSKIPRTATHHPYFLVCFELLNDLHYT